MMRSLRRDCQSHAGGPASRKCRIRHASYGGKMGHGEKTDLLFFFSFPKWHESTMPWLRAARARKSVTGRVVLLHRSCGEWDRKTAQDGIPWPLRPDHFPLLRSKGMQVIAATDADGSVGTDGC